MSSPENPDLSFNIRLLDRFYGVFAFVSIVFMTVGVPFIFYRKIAAAVMIVVLMVAVAAAWRMSRRGQPEKSLKLFAAVLWVMMMALIFGGLPPIIAFALAVAVMLAVVVRIRLGVLFGVSYMVVWLAYIVLTAMGLAPAPYFTGKPLVIWFIGVVSVWLVLLPIPQLIRSLRDALSLQRATLESTADGVLVVDSQGKVITTYNQRFAEMWRIPSEILAIRDDKTLLRFVRDQLAEPQAFEARIKELYAHPEESALDVIPLQDGRIFERYSIPQRLGDQVVGRVWSFREVTEHKRLERELLQFNQTLAQQVEAEVAKNLDQERLLIQQARLAAMGEMIGNIAHQWRQPLNALTLVLANLKDAYEYRELDKPYLDTAVAKGQQMIQNMSSTIDDFRNFFRPNKVKQRFRACDAVSDAIKLVSHGFNSHNIEIELEKSRVSCEVMGYPNEFAQVVLNALSNAKEAIVEKKISGKVLISVGGGADKVTVSIRDNGGGVPEEILGKVFDPYFTTKEKGTGIGLYMSKMIMDHMDGGIALGNVEGGAEVLLTLPLSKLAGD